MSIVALASYAPMSHAAFENPNGFNYRDLFSPNLEEKTVPETLSPNKEEIPYEPLGDFKDPHYEFNPDTQEWELFEGEKDE